MMTTTRFLLAAAALLAFVACRPPSAWDMPPIIGAARGGDTTRLEQLLAAGADPNVQAGVNHWTPLLHAIHKNQVGSVRVLLDHGARIDAPGGGGVTPLIMAAGYGYTPIVRMLLDAGADPRLSDHHGTDALSAAVAGVPDIDRFTVGHCQTETVRALLAADRSLRLRPDVLTRTAAQFAGCDAVLELLAARQSMER